VPAFVVAIGLVAVPLRAYAAPRLSFSVVRDVKTGRDPYPALTRPVPGDSNADDGYAQPDTEIEPSIAVNPANPRNAVAVYQEGRFADGGSYTTGYATTLDAGHTWRTGPLPKLTLNGRLGGPWERASDPVVAFGPHNLVYANSLVIDINRNNGLHSGLAVNVSKDGGRHWSAPVFIQDDNLGGTNDKNWIVVDNSSAPGHHLGRVYAVWDRGAPIVYDYCDQNCDQLSNWLPNLQTIPGIVFPTEGISAIPVIQKDGGLGIVILSLAGIPQIPPDIVVGNEVTYIPAPLAGSTPYPVPLAFLPPIDVAGDQSMPVRAQRTGGLVDADVDPRSGTIYATWEDTRFRTDGTNDIVLSRSTDNGLTWSAPLRVNRDRTNDHIDHYTPTVAVGAGGRVHISWRQRNESGDSPTEHPLIDTYYAQSRDGGRTFTRAVRVNRVSSDMRYDAFSRGGAFEGDYSEVASARGITYIVRCQGAPARRGEPPALTASSDTQVELSGRGHQHQSAWVAVLTDR
jgi:hypothetical protein